MEKMPRTHFRTFFKIERKNVLNRRSVLSRDVKWPRTVFLRSIVLFAFVFSNFQVLRKNRTLASLIGTYNDLGLRYILGNTYFLCSFETIVTRNFTNESVRVFLCSTTLLNKY
jgi:hypothetical protein